MNKKSNMFFIVIILATIRISQHFNYFKEGLLKKEKLKGNPDFKLKLLANRLKPLKQRYD